MKNLVPFVACLVAVACSSVSSTEKPASDYPRLGAANEVEHSGPLGEGQRAFLYETWGTEELNTWPPADFMLGLMRTEPEVFGNQFERFGFVHDDNDEFPVGFKRGAKDPSRVHETCAQCHVGRLPDGRLWLGAPNTKLDIGRFKVEVNRRWVASGQPSKLTPLKEKKALLLGPGRFNAETGEYPDVVPADFPVYFDLAKRTRLNYLGTGRNVRTEAYFAIYTFGAGSPNKQTAKVPFPSEDKLAPFLLFFGAMKSPSNPRREEALVARGETVFVEARCNTCHHVEDIGRDQVVTLDKAADGRERLPGEDPEFPRGSIRTSGQHSIIQDPSAPGNADRGYKDLIAFMLEQKIQASGSDGYRPSDLHGLWASAPYLHNGSVPTLEDLLKPPPDRPLQFSRGAFLVDTTKTGNENGGHTFGTALSSADKAALIAYLESL